MDKWEKVLELHRLFSTRRRPLSLSFLCERLECAEPTFHRIRKFMVDTLDAPIVFDAACRGYRFDPAATDRFELPGLWLTSRETETLLGFHHAIEGLQKGFFSEVFSPVKKQLFRFLKSQNLSSKHDHLPIGIIPLHSRPVDDTLFRTIADAVIRGRTLDIEHGKPSADATVKRIVSPLTLIRYRDNWYLDAYCHLRGELRSFALNRIRTAAYSDEKFHHVPKMEREHFFAEAYGIFNGPAGHTACIKFTGTAAEIVSQEQWHPKQLAEWTSDHHYVLSIPYGDDRELIMDILKWGQNAEVISPDDLRSKVKLLLINTLRNYEK